MTEQEFIKKTSPMVSFLTNCLNEDAKIQIIVAQANRNSERLVELLELVKGKCEDWIEELKAMEG